MFTSIFKVVFLLDSLNGVFQKRCGGIPSSNSQPLALPWLLFLEYIHNAFNK